MVYYEMMFNDHDSTGWELAVDWERPDGTWRDVWAYTRCESFSGCEELPVVISHDGDVRDFNLANFNIPIISKRFGEILQRVALTEIQRIPIVIVGQRNWEVLHVLNSVECFDYGRSQADYYPTDPIDPAIAEAPELAGTPRGVWRLRIDPDKAGGLHVFRIAHWEVPIIVSHIAKHSLEVAGMTGLRFQCVS